MKPCVVCGEPVKRKTATYCTKSCASRGQGAKFLGLKCSVEECDRTRKSNGLCPMHAKRMWATGHTDIVNEWRGLTDEERFWKRVDKTGDCWLWTGPVNNMGYGRHSTYSAGTTTRHLAHRYSMQIASRLEGDKVILHSCDTPRCVNPDHMSMGTQLDNIRDAIAKGRLNMDGLELGWRKREKAHA